VLVQYIPFKTVIFLLKVLSDERNIRGVGVNWGVVSY
jgi:hypothetical protein